MLFYPNYQEREPGQDPRPALVPYPHGDHDHNGKEARPHCVPGGPAVQLQGHGEDQSAQEKQNLGKTQGRWQGHRSPRPGSSLMAQGPAEAGGLGLLVIPLSLLPPSTSASPLGATGTPCPAPLAGREVPLLQLLYCWDPSVPRVHLQVDF